MKVILEQQVELSADEAWRVFCDRLNTLTKQPGRWERDGHVWEDDPDWRHGSVNEVRVKYKSRKEERADIKRLLRIERIRVAAQALIALLDDAEHEGAGR